jgi:hypothetical protein
MSYWKSPRPRADSDDFIALVLDLRPLAWPIRWAWRALLIAHELLPHDATRKED